MRTRRARTIAALCAAGVAAAVLIGFFVLRAVSPGAPPAAHTPGASPSQPITPPVIAISKTCNVVDYGADPSGAKDSQAGIAAAVQACSAAPGGEVLLPAGTFALLSGGNIAVTGPAGPLIKGAGPDATFLVQHGRKDIFDIRADGTTVEDVNLDTATYNPGVPPQAKNPVPLVLFANASHITVYNIKGEAGTGFGLRVIGPNPCQNYTRGFNTVANVDMTTTGKGGFAAVDIDCQHDTRVANITIHGGILALFRDTRTTLDGEQYSPGPFAERCEAPWFITGPASDVTVTNVVSQGGRGIIHGTTSNITVTNQTVNTAGC